MIIFLKVFGIMMVLACLLAGIIDAINRWNRRGSA